MTPLRFIYFILRHLQCSNASEEGQAEVAELTVVTESLERKGSASTEVLSGSHRSLESLLRSFLRLLDTAEISRSFAGVV